MMYLLSTLPNPLSLYVKWVLRKLPGWGTLGWGKLQPGEALRAKEEWRIENTNNSTNIPV